MGVSVVLLLGALDNTLTGVVGKLVGALDGLRVNYSWCRCSSSHRQHQHAEK